MMTENVRIEVEKGSIGDGERRDWVVRGMLFEDVKCRGTWLRERKGREKEGNSETL